jgi:flagellar motor switch protein FliN
MDKNDPYLSELDAIEDMDHDEHDTGKTDIGDLSVTHRQKTAGGFEGDEKTTIDSAGITHGGVSTEEGDDFFAAEDEVSEVEGESQDEISEEVPVQEILDLSPDMSVPLVIVMGRKNYTVKDLLDLRMGQVLDLDRPPLDPVDLVAGGRVIGKGELVEVEGNLGVRILKLFK